MIPIPSPYSLARPEPTLGPMGRFELPVDRRPATTLGRVVDDVVVDEHPALEVLDGGRRVQRRPRIASGGREVAPEHEDGPEPLAAAERELEIDVEVRPKRGGCGPSLERVRPPQALLDRRKIAIETREVHGGCLWTTIVYNAPELARLDGHSHVRPAGRRSGRSNGAEARFGEADPGGPRPPNERRLPLRVPGGPAHGLARDRSSAACGRRRRTDTARSADARALAATHRRRGREGEWHGRGGSPIRGTGPPARLREPSGRRAAGSTRGPAPAPAQRPTAGRHDAAGEDLARLGRPRPRVAVLPPGGPDEARVPSREGRGRPCAARPRARGRRRTGASPRSSPLTPRTWTPVSGRPRFSGRTRSRRTRSRCTGSSWQRTRPAPRCGRTSSPPSSTWGTGAAPGWRSRRCWRGPRRTRSFVSCTP